MSQEKVAVLGASRKPERYSHKAVVMLLEHGHEVYPVSPGGDTILEQPGFTSLEEISTAIDTITVYVSPQRLEPLVEEILATSPKRVIFNPGTESPEIQEQLADAGIQVVEACTLVLLSTDQY